MSFHRLQFATLVRDTLDAMGYGGRNATMLLLGTAAHESDYGTYLEQLGSGPALGVFQMEPATLHDIFANYLWYKPPLREQLSETTGERYPLISHLRGNLLYQICMARIHYLRVPTPLPHYTDVRGMADYWYYHWQTPKGAKFPVHFLMAYERHGLGILPAQLWPFYGRDTDAQV